MHILLITDYFSPHIGGSEKLFSDLANFLLEQGNTITIITSRHSPSLPRHEIKTHNNSTLTIYRVGSGRKDFLRQCLWFGLSHATLLKTIDHIHTTTFSAAVPARILASLFKKHITITIHEIYDTQWYTLKGNLMGLLYIGYEHLICKICSRNKIVTPSHFTKTMIHNKYHLPESTLQVIYNQIDYKFWSPLHNSSPASQSGIFIGRLGQEKGLESVLYALPIVQQTLPDFQLTILTDTNNTEKKHFDHIIQQLNIKSMIHRHHSLQSEEELKKMMSQTSIGIVPSMSEGFCYTAVQFEALGIPLVVSARGALPEVLSPDHYFFSFGDQKDIAKGIIEMIQIPRTITSKRKFEHTLVAYQDLIYSLQQQIMTTAA